MDYSRAKQEGRHPVRFEGEVPVDSTGRSAFYYPAEEEDISLLDYWRILTKRKWQVIFITLLFVFLGVAASFLLPKKYQAHATLMPLTASGSGGLSGIANQLSSIPLVGSQLGGVGGLGGGKSKELVNILKSRTLAKNIVKKFNLMRVYFAKRWDPQTNSYRPNWVGDVPIEEDAINIFLKRSTDIEEDKKTGLIKIEVETKSPVLSAQIANEMLLELQSFLERNSFTISKRNRLFIEEQLVKNGAKLLQAGKELNNFFGQSQISSVVPQLDVNVGTYQFVPKPFEDFQQEFDSLQLQRKDVEQKKSESVKGVPGQVYLQYLTLNRELISRAHALLTQQYEMAKIEEAKEDLAFQVIDKPEVRKRPSSPNLIRNVAAGLVGGLFLGIFLAFFREYIQQMKAKEACR